MHWWGRLGAPRTRARRIIGRTIAGSFIAILAMAVLAPLASAHRARITPAAAQGHPYRQGVVPLRGHQARSASTSTSSNNLSFGGGIGGVAVTTGPPKVYLVFWGKQWGTPTWNGNLISSLSGDPSGMAPYLENFIEGLGGGSDADAAGARTWSGVMTQYCQSSSTVAVATGSTTCPSGASQVGYPGGAADGGALAGVLLDESANAPSQATGNQIGSEAVWAAGQTGDFSQNAQYVVVSPTGTHPDGFNTLFGQFCAWHDYTGDSTLSGGAVSSPSPLAFTNLPYVTDMGTSCGANFVNAGTAGALDGVSIVEGHEYAETITDQFPAGGWTDSSGNENGDKCAWISSGQGAAQDVAFGTGSFAVQSTWGNDITGCEISDQIVTSGSGTTQNTVTITSPTGPQSGTVGTPVSIQVSASDSGGAAITSYGASGLPPGLAINASTGVISGTPTTAGSYSSTLTATDSTGATGSTSFTWTIGGNDFSLSASQSSLSVRRGQSVTDAISAAVTSGSPETVSLSASGLPSSATASFNPASITSGGSSSTMTISTSSATPNGSYTITVTGTSGGTTHTTVITLTVRKH